MKVGIVGGTLPVPDGIFETSTVVNRNGIDFQVDRTIEYLADEADGVGGADTCDLDYKKVEVTVSWDERFSGEVVLTTDIVPKNTAEEINSCAAQPGGILSVTVFDAFGLWIGEGAPRIEVFDAGTGSSVAVYQPEDGKHDF